MYITIEETRNKEIWVDAEDFDEAVEMAESIYKGGGYDLHCDTEVHALVGDGEHEFQEIAVWFC